MISLPRVVLFDWDGTLANATDAIVDIMRKTLLDMGRDPSGYKLDEAPYLPRMQQLMEVFGDSWKEANDIFVKHANNSDVRGVKLYDGVQSMLALLKSEGHRMGVVSNKLNTSLRKEIDFFGLGNYFDVTVGSGDTDEDKPSSKPVMYALEQLEVEPCTKNVVLVGDSIADLQCASNSGIGFIKYGQRDMQGFDVKLSVDDHDELMKCFGYKQA